MAGCLIEPTHYLNVDLTHWDRVTHICVGNLTIIGSDNGLSPGQRQAIIWTNAGILLIGSLGTNFSQILIEILAFSFKKMCLKLSSAKWRLFCLGLNVLTSMMSSGIHLRAMSYYNNYRGGIENYTFPMSPHLPGAGGFSFSPTFSISNDTYSMEGTLDLDTAVWCHLIFVMGIPLLVKWHLYIETAPWLWR